MEVCIGHERFAPVPEELAPLIRAAARRQGRAVTVLPSGALQVTEPPLGAALAPGPEAMLPAGDGRWISPRARAAEQEMRAR